MHDYNRYDNEIICPYCGYRFNDSEEMIDTYKREKTKITCSECKKKFWATACVSVEYRASRDCKINGDEHEFEKMKHFKMSICKKCGLREYSSD